MEREESNSEAVQEERKKKGVDKEKRGSGAVKQREEGLKNEKREPSMTEGLAEGDKAEGRSSVEWALVNASAGYLYLPIKIANREVFALVDSGSMHSIISKNLMEKLQGDLTVKETGVKLKAAGGTPIYVQGEVHDKVGVGGREMGVTLVVAHILEDIIIGSDFLTENGATLDFQNLVLTMRGNEVPVVRIKKGESARKGAVKLIQTKDVEGKGVIKCQLTGDNLNLPGTYWYKPSVEGKASKGACLVNLCKPEIEVEVGSEVPELSIRFQEGDILGEIVEVNEEYWRTHEDTWNWPKELRVKEIYEKLKVEENEHVTKEEKEQCRRLIEEYHDIFSLSTKELGLTDLYVHKIKVKDDKVIINKNRPIPLHMFDEAKRMVTELLDLGVLEPSNAIHRSPLVLVNKPNSNQKRFCLDYRILNSYTEDNLHPMPTVMETRNIWAGCKWWSVLDLSMAYFQIPLHEDSRDWTTIWVNGLGSYRFTRVPMGGKTSGAALQALTDFLFGDVKKSVVNNFLDDFVTGAKSVAEMLENLEMIFERLRQGKLKIKCEKCSVLKKEVMFLGCRLNEQGLWANEAKIQCLLDMAPPKDRKDVQRFCGLMNFFREFVPNMADLARGVTDLLKKEGEFNFDERAEKSFKEIKEALTKPPCLVWADPEKEFHLFTDSSNSCLGYCLMQYDEQNRLHPVFFGSKCLGQSQLLWPSFCKEFYAAYVAITRLRYYLYGKKFTLYTDCQGITFSKTMKKCTTNAVLRWAIELSAFTFDIEFVPGSKNVVADTLSRLPATEQLEALPRRSRELYDYFKKGAKRMHKKKTEDKEETGRGPGEVDHPNEGEDESHDLVNRVEKVINNPMSSVHIGDEKFVEAAKNDRVFSKVKEWVRGENKAEDPMKLEPALRRYHNKLERLTINEQGLLCMTYYNNQMRVTKKLVCVPEALIESIMCVYHELASGHLAADKTESKIRQKFYFPNMQEQVRLFCKTCGQCFKTNVYYKKGEKTMLKPVVYKYPGLCVAMDVVMVKKGGNESKVLTITDKFTKWVGFFPIRDEKAKTIARIFVDKWVCYWSVPEMLITDNAVSFKTSEVMNNVYRLLGIEKKYCSSYHPEGNGEAERKNKVLIHMLQKLVDEFPSRWKNFLPQLQLAVNSAQNRSTGFSAFKLMTGREMRGLENVVFDVRNTEYYMSEAHLANQTYKELRRVFQIASDNLDLSHALQKKLYDRNKTHIDLIEGDRVLLHRPKDTSNPYYKLKSHWQGPHVIIKVFDEHNYLIREEKEGKEQVVHRNHLRKLPEGMRGRLAAGEVGTESFEKSKGDNRLEKEGSDNEGEEGRSEEEPETDEEYFYPDVRKIVETEEWNVEEESVSKQEEEEVERTVDPNIFRKYVGEDRGTTYKQNVNFWEVSEQEGVNRGCSSTSSSMPDLEQVLRELSKEAKGKFKRPRYTEFREVGEDNQEKEENSRDKEIEMRGEGSERRDNEGSRSDSGDRSGSKTPRGRDGSETPPLSGFRKLETPPRDRGDVTPIELRGEGMKTPPVKPNFERPLGASTPKLSALVADMRRDEEEMRGKCESLRGRMEDMDKDLENLGKRLVQGMEQGEVRRSERNKNKIINYKAEKNPDGP